MESIACVIDKKRQTSFLRWAGSKKQLTFELAKYWESKKFDKYIEPFLGAGHLFFSISPEQSILSDINDELITTYKAIRSIPDEVGVLLSKMPVEEMYYYEIRSINTTNLTEAERAARFIYLNRFCFNGLYRTNSKGEFNVPFSKTKTGTLPNIEILSNFSEKLKDSLLFSCDFENLIIDNVDSNDFVYLDPPYHDISKRSFTEYSFPKFGSSDLIRLIELLELINDRGAYFLMSYINNESILNLTKRWIVKNHFTGRRLSSNTKSRKQVEEIFITNIRM